MKIAGVILAGGLGSRMGNLTVLTPKPMLQVGGRPILGHAIEKILDAGIDSIFINLHYRAERIMDYVAGLSCQNKITCRTQEVLNGPAGALSIFRRELEAFDQILISSADVVCSSAYGPLVAHNIARQADFTFGCTTSDKASRYGVLNLSDSGSVLSCVEKPSVPDHEVHHISAGMYCARPNVLEYIPDHGNFDYARDLAPALLEHGRNVQAWIINGYWRDIGSPESLITARRDFANGHFAFQQGERCVGRAVL